jgi:hypothetical protein
LIQERYSLQKRQDKMNTITVKEAKEKQIRRIRMPNWNPKAYLKLDFTPDGLCGPWVSLYDEDGQNALNIPVGSQKVLIFSIIDAVGYEIYTGEPSKWE